MYPLIITALALTALFLILFQKATLMIRCSEKFELVIDYSFFEISFKRTKRHKKKKQKISKLSLLHSLKRALNLVIPKSELSISSPIIKGNRASVSTDAILYGISFSVFAPILACLNAVAPRLQFNPQPNDITHFEISIKSRLYIFLSACIIFLFENSKERVRKCQKTG